MNPQFEFLYSGLQSTELATFEDAVLCAVCLLEKHSIQHAQPDVTQRHLPCFEWDFSQHECDTLVNIIAKLLPTSSHKGTLFWVLGKGKPENTLSPLLDAMSNLWTYLGVEEKYQAAIALENMVGFEQYQTVPNIIEIARSSSIFSTLLQEMATYDEKTRAVVERITTAVA